MKKNFTKISNEITLGKMSLKSKGLYSLIKYHINIPGFKLKKKNILAMCDEGEGSFNTAWNELKELGILKCKRINNNGFKYEYELSDSIGGN